jgi:hypothetical protein
MAKYNTPDDHVPGFKKQKSVVGSYTSDDNSKTNPLADDLDEQEACSRL